MFSGRDAAGKVQLWVRALDASTSTPIAGTENGLLPFWSPDGRSVGFFADGKLKRVDVTGGSPLALYDVGRVGGAWAPNGDILFSGPAGPIYAATRLGRSGGRPVTKLDAARGETAHRYPFFLPDGKHFLYLAMNVAGGRKHPANRLWVGSLDAAPARPLVATKSTTQYSEGHLLFVRGGNFGGSLLAQPFDPARLETSGTPVTLADQVGAVRRVRRVRQLLGVGQRNAAHGRVASRSGGSSGSIARAPGRASSASGAAVRVPHLAGRLARGDIDLRSEQSDECRSGSATRLAAFGRA